MADEGRVDDPAADENTSAARTPTAIDAAIRAHRTGVKRQATPRALRKDALPSAPKSAQVSEYVFEGYEDQWALLLSTPKPSTVSPLGVDDPMFISAGEPYLVWPTLCWQGA